MHNFAQDRDTSDPAVFYASLKNQLEAVMFEEPHPLPNLANAASVLYNALENVNWCGFYLLMDGILVLGPFQGKPACIRIPVGCGVCGTCAETRVTQLVPDVHKFPGHIACDSASNSEIVIPLFHKGELFGVLDIDSPVLNRFTEADREGLEACALLIARTCAHWNPGA